MKQALILPLLMLASPVAAQDMSAFVTGPVIEDFGPHAPVDADMEIPEGTVFKVAFDTSKAAEDGARNRTLESASRFYNMTAAAGVPVEDIQIAVVVHGKAGFDLFSNAAWAEKHDGADNPSQPLLRALLDKGVRVILCGQSAAALGMEKGQLEPGVELALSAMTAHALLRDEGYGVNPF
ncbi:MAG: DsrE family protein [Sphingomonadaceae bacterium]|nr:DsrE family protein [Sphingomonadaceae bacterium]